MKRRLNILSILVFIVLGLSLYTTGYQFGTGMKARNESGQRTAQGIESM